MIDSYLDISVFTPVSAPGVFDEVITEGNVLNPDFESPCCESRGGECNSRIMRIKIIPYCDNSMVQDDPAIS